MGHLQRHDIVLYGDHEKFGFVVKGVTLPVDTSWLNGDPVHFQGSLTGGWPALPGRTVPYCSVRSYPLMLT